MADDDKDFSFGDFGEEFSSGDDGWDALSDDAEAAEDDFLKEVVGDEEAEPSATEAAGEEPREQEAEPTSVETKPSRFSGRMVLYGLLAVILSSAGFYYFSSSPRPPAVELPPVSSTQTVAMPERPEPGAEQRDAVLEIAVPKGTLLEVMPGESAVPVAVQPEPPAAPPQPQPQKEKLELLAAPVADKTAGTAPTVAGPKPAVAGAVSSPESVSRETMPENPAVERSYYIQAGVFFNPRYRDEALKQIRQLGFEPRVETIRRVRPMTRVLLGVYAPEKAEEVVAGWEATLPGIFALEQGDQVAVYAGSFFAPSRAEQLVDELAQKGIQASPKQVEAEVDLYRVTFGDFPDRTTAAATGEQVKTLGLEAHIVQRR